MTALRRFSLGATGNNNTNTYSHARGGTTAAVNSTLHHAVQRSDGARHHSDDSHHLSSEFNNDNRHRHHHHRNYSSHYDETTPTSITTTPPSSYYCGLSKTTIHTLRYVLYSKLWQFTILISILGLLFGPSIHAIWMSTTTDDNVRILLFLAVILLVWDILMRCIVDRNYFSWDCSNNNDGKKKRRHWWQYIYFWDHIGSFMFWFDMLSLIPVIWIITFSLLSTAAEFTIVVNDFGFPLVSGGSYGNLRYRGPWSSGFTVGSFALMARFIRTSWLVRLSRKFKLHSLEHCSCLGRRNVCGSSSGSSSTTRMKEGGGGENLREFDDPFSIPSIGINNAHDGKNISNNIEKSDHNKSAADPSTSKHERGMKRSSFLTNHKENHSQVGTAMRELTGQRVALGALLAVFMSTALEWREWDTTPISTMIFLHGQTSNLQYANAALDMARSTVIPQLVNYTRTDINSRKAMDDSMLLTKTYDDIYSDYLRDQHIIKITISGQGYITIGNFNMYKEWRDDAMVKFVTTIFILILWVMAEIIFGGPLMNLVVHPIERMVRLLSMMTMDPLGYRSTAEFRQLLQEDEEITNESWTKEMIRGMETHYLMSTIQRIADLLRIGFGSAGVEIIRNNLISGRNEDVLLLNKQGGNVSCIFLFCDIRQFTDATESLQEEVFVFTNKIAAVVHSICHSYGGSANKNIGDAFLVSWRLDESPVKENDDNDADDYHLRGRTSGFTANSNQADKALLSVVKISQALFYDEYFTHGMSEAAKTRLKTKLCNRMGPLVQMGFGLHAGSAVQGAIGSQRKLDATYISGSVERAEFLESSTKTYGVPILMSDSFYNLLDSANRYRCRKVDQLLFLNEDNSNLTDPLEILDCGEKMNLYTFDMDIDALWRDEDDIDLSTKSMQLSNSGGSLRQLPSAIRSLSFSDRPQSTLTTNDYARRSLKDIEKAIQAERAEIHKFDSRPTELILPNGTQQYTDKAWHEPDIKKIRRVYVSNGIIFPKYQEGLKAYYAKDWEHAKKCFEFVLSQRVDGPSLHFLKLMEEHDGKCPRNFNGYTIERD